MAYAFTPGFEDLSDPSSAEMLRTGPFCSQERSWYGVGMDGQPRDADPSMAESTLQLLDVVSGLFWYPARALPRILGRRIVPLEAGVVRVVLAGTEVAETDGIPSSTAFELGAGMTVLRRGGRRHGGTPWNRQVRPCGMRADALDTATERSAPLPPPHGAAPPQTNEDPSESAVSRAPLR